jgi:hypothetical protein
LTEQIYPTPKSLSQCDWPYRANIDVALASGGGLVTNPVRSTLRGVVSVVYRQTFRGRQGLTANSSVSTRCALISERVGAFNSSIRARIIENHRQREAVQAYAGKWCRQIRRCPLLGLGSPFTFGLPGSSQPPVTSSSPPPAPPSRRLLMPDLHAEGFAGSRYAREGDQTGQAVDRV